jgi:hypothetical protein
MVGTGMNTSGSAWANQPTMGGPFGGGVSKSNISNQIFYFFR